MLSLLIVVIVATLIFDYINGFHDSANAIATSVSTGVLPLRTAVILAGIFNFIGALTGTAVASTIATGLVDPAAASLGVLLATLIGASTWNLMTWWWGIPSSSSHALIGGLAGATLAHAGVGAFNWPKLIDKVLKPLVLSPLIGFSVALLLMIALIWLLRGLRPRTVQVASRRLQLVSACTFSISHGSNDAQKSMGIILLGLLAYMAWAKANGGEAMPEWMRPSAAIDAKGKTTYGVPYWAMLSCALAMGLGTMAGGKRIIKTMGSKIIRISPLQGFVAETAGTGTILAMSALGNPVSTTHCINACIMGVGASKRISAVRWIVAWKILIAWIVTLPLSALMAWLTMLGLKLVGID